MAGKDVYGAQSFFFDPQGKLGLGRFHPCKSADDARKTAEERVAFGRAAGAAAFLRRGSGKFHEGEVITIATYGIVPPDVADQLPF